MTPVKNSFTLLEVILAITILTLAVGGSFVLIQQTVGSVSQVQSRLIASYLLQEGIEIIKNIRDSNWLKGNDFDYGLEKNSIGEGYEVDYNDLDLTPCTLPCDYDNNLHFLGIDGNGFYGYDYSLGNETIFKRKITISDKVDLDGDEKADKLKVTVEVFWKERGKNYSISSQEFLYNWNQ
jgi:hypothetical protein